VNSTWIFWVTRISFFSKLKQRAGLNFSSLEKKA
jgi:hypothetical protein